MPDKHTNFAVSTIVAAPSPNTTGTTGVAVQTGDGAHFPAPPFNAVVFPANSPPGSANAEIIRIFSGPPADTGWVIKRQQEGTSARAIQPGDQIVAGFTNRSFTDIEDVLGASGYRGAVMIESGLVSYWRLGERRGSSFAHDEKNANPGDWEGGVTLEQPGALVTDPNPAVQFDGTSAYIAVPDDPSLRITGAITLEAWVKPTAAATAGIISKWGVGNVLLAYTNTRTVRFWVKASGFSVESGPLLQDTWSHVVATYDGTNAIIYINGQQAATAAESAPINVSTDPFEIGAYSGAANFFPGFLDEVAVYNTALSAARILAHYQAAARNRGVRVVQAAPTNPPSATWTSVTFGAEVYKDDPGLHSLTTNTARLTCVTPGHHLIFGAVEFASNATGLRYTRILINGATPADSVNGAAVSGDVTQQKVGTSYALQAGDYVELQVFQTSGGALNVDVANTYFAMERISG